MTNRLIGMILILALVLGAFSVLPVSAEEKIRNPFVPFEALSYDDVVIKTGSIDTKNGGLGGICDGSYAVFKNLNFTEAPIKVIVENATASNYNSYYEIRLDSPEGKILGRWFPLNTGGWNSYKEKVVPITEEITGIHDIYFVFTGNALAPVRNITFVPTSEQMLRFPTAKVKNEYTDITNEEDYAVADTLVSLGLTSADSDGIYGNHMEFTIEEALNVACVLNGLDFEKHIKPTGMSDADFVKNFGYDMGYDFDRYAENDPITVKDFTGLLLGTLGWLEVIDYIDADVMLLGNKLKLFTDVISRGKDELLNKRDASRMIYNALSAKVLEIDSYSNNGNTYREINDIGVMAVFADVYKDEGIVDGNVLTTLTTANSQIDDDEVSIEGKIYKAGKSGVAYAIGSRVEYFYKYDSKTKKKTILYYETTDEQSVTIASDDIRCITMDKIEYYDGDRKKAISYDNSATVIYNGVLAEKYNSLASLIGDLDKFKGSITVTDNGEKSIIRVYSYKSALMQRFSESTGILVDEYGNNINFKKNGVSLQEMEFKYTAYNSNGGIVELETYPSHTVVDVAISHNTSGCNYIQVIVPENVIYGEVTYVGSDSEVTIDGISYKLASEYISAVEMGKADKIDASSKGNFSLDSFGNICAYESDIQDIVGIIMGFENKSSAFLDELKVKLYTYEGEFLNANFAQKAVIDGHRVSANDSRFTSLKDVTKYFKDNLENLKGTVVSYRINKNKEIYYFDTLLSSARNNSDRMKRLVSVRSVSKIINGVINDSVVWDGKVIFRAPLSGSVGFDNESYYSVLETIPSGEDMFDCYSTTGDEVVANVTVCVGEKFQWMYNKLLIERISTVLLPDGTPTHAVEGWLYGYAFKPEKVKLNFDSIEAYKTPMSKTLEPGDVINVAYDINNFIINAGDSSELPSGSTTSSIMYDYSKNDIVSVTSTKGEYGIHCVAEIVKMTDKYMFYETSAGETGVANITTSRVLCFDNKTKKVRTANLADLYTRENNGTGTKALLSIDNRKASTIIYFEN